MKKNYMLSRALLVAGLGLCSSQLHSAPSLSDGFDWSLPAYAAGSETGGMISENGNGDPDVRGTFLPVLWRISESSPGQFDFSSFEQRLNQSSGAVLVRLEVNSKCHAPDWATIPALDNQTLQFWQPAYVAQITDFVTEFADRYKDNPKIIGVQLGIADGEYYQDDNADDVPDRSDCPTGNSFNERVYGGGRDGWGEFWANEDLGELSASIANGLTPDNFESSTKNIIDLYASAFDNYEYKLAFTNFEIFSSPEFNARMPAIVDYSMANGLGNRGGEIEAWMRYTNQSYGVDLITSNSVDGSCDMVFDEDFADSIQGFYWGDENEFYGTDSYITESSGPVSNQAYRFYVSSMRALQLRRNYFSINKSGHEYLRSINDQYEYEYTDNGAYNSALLTKYKSGDFINYLSKTLGRSRADTPDAFVVLGDRTVTTSYEIYPTEYRLGNTSEQCLIDGSNRGYTVVNQFGRWLSVMNDTVADASMRKDVADWGLTMPAERNGGLYELYARKSAAFLFDVNDQLIGERCEYGCAVEAKIVFKDDHVMNLRLNHAGGVSDVVTTQGDGKTKTVTFPINARFDNALNGGDFSVGTNDGSQLSILMARLNIVSANPAPPLTNQPEITLPITGAQLSGATVDFSWTSVDEGAGDNSTTQYWLEVGSSLGRDDYFGQNLGTKLSASVDGLPTDGSTVYVRLYYNTDYDFIDVEYSSAVLPSMITPSNGSSLTGASQTFKWQSNGANVSSYWLDVGSTPKGDDIFSKKMSSTTTQYTVDALPTDGSEIYVTLYYTSDYDSVQYRYTSAN